MFDSAKLSKLLKDVESESTLKKNVNWEKLKEAIFDLYRWSKEVEMSEKEAKSGWEAEVYKYENLLKSYETLLETTKGATNV